MVRWLIGACCVLASALLQAAPEITTRLDASQVDELQTVRMFVRVTGTSTVDDIDTTPLEQDFLVLGVNSSSQYRRVNGVETSWVELQIALRPKRTGTLTIPPLSVAGGHTTAQTVRVKGLDPELRKEIESLAFFEVEMSAPTSYVQAEVILTRRLYYTSGVQIYSDLPGAPVLDDAVVIPLGEATSTTTMRASQRYGILEQRYALFPEKPGQFTVPGVGVTASVRLADNRRRGVVIEAPPTSVTVLPIPAEYPADQPWLPARSVSLEEFWAPDQDAVNVGTPMTRTITLSAIGALGSAIAPLPLDFRDPHLKVYPQPPQNTDNALGASVQGTRTEQWSVIPAAAGQITLPALSVTWWDTQARQVRTSTLPARTLALRPDPDSNADDAKSVSSALAAEAGGDQSEVPGVLPAPAQQTPRISRYVLAAGAMLLIILAIAWWWPRRGSRQAAGSPHASTVSRPDAALYLRQLEALLRDSGTLATPVKLKTAIDEWLSAVFAQPPGIAWRTVSRGHPTAASLHRTLLNACHANVPVPDHCVNDIQTLIREINDGQTDHTRPYALPPLYVN